MFRIKTNGCRRRNAKGCGFLGGGVALGETERWGRVSQTIKNEITIVSLIFKDSVVKHLQLYTTSTDRLISMYRSFNRQVRSLKTKEMIEQFLISES